MLHIMFEFVPLVALPHSTKNRFSKRTEIQSLFGHIHFRDLEKVIDNIH